MRSGTILLLTLWLASSAQAGDWTRFRGPQGSGTSDEKQLPIRWDETTNRKWKVELPGRGLSSPVIAGDRVYLTACSGYKQRKLHVLCFHATNGKKLWERRFTATGNTACHPKTNMASCTPVADANRVFALFATGDLAALDKNGNLLWYRSLVGDYPKITNQVGAAASPTLWNQILLLPMENAGESFAAGIDAKTGKNLWKVKRPRGTNWVTPMVYTRGGQAEAIFQTRDEVTALDPTTGKQLWQLKDLKISSAACPQAGPGVIFLPGRPFLAIRPAGANRKPETVWESNRLSSGYSSPLYHNGKVYALTQQGPRCADAKTGTEEWRLRAEGPFSASPVLADGKLYAANEKGVVFVIKIGKKPEVLAKNDMKETLLASPAIANGSLFLRSDKHLWCLSAK